MRHFIILATLTAALFVAGCTEEQIRDIDKKVSDVNNAATIITSTAGDTPIGAMLPADWKLYLAMAATVTSGAANIWQKLRGDLMKKTTKAIVKGIEATVPKRTANPGDPVKANISANMKEAKIYDKANLLVDKMKLGLI